MLGVQSPEEASSDMGTPGSQLPEQPKESRLMEASGTNGLSRAQRTPWPKRPQGGRLMRDSGTNEPSARPSLPLTPPPKRPQGGRLMRDSKNNLPTLEEDSEN
jgi:hypothetical protein